MARPKMSEAAALVKGEAQWNVDHGGLEHTVQQQDNLEKPIEFEHVDLFSSDSEPSAERMESDLLTSMAVVHGRRRNSKQDDKLQDAATARTTSPEQEWRSKPNLVVEERTSPRKKRKQSAPRQVDPETESDGSPESSQIALKCPTQTPLRMSSATREGLGGIKTMCADMPSFTKQSKEEHWGKDDLYSASDESIEEQSEQESDSIDHLKVVQEPRKLKHDRPQVLQDMNDDAPQPQKDNTQVYGKKKFPHLCQLKDGDGKMFYAYEDPDMIRWLGKTTFNEILRFNPIGRINQYKVGDQKNMCLWKSTMTYCRKRAVSLYTQVEYEQLVVEAHVESKPTHLRRTAGRRAQYMCVYCREPYIDKNRLSWHRMTSECKKKPPGSFLKMYPTCNKGSKKELQRILQNQEKKSLSPEAAQKSCHEVLQKSDMQIKMTKYLDKGTSSKDHKDFSEKKSTPIVKTKYMSKEKRQSPRSPTLIEPSSTLPRITRSKSSNHGKLNLNRTQDTIADPLTSKIPDKEISSTAGHRTKHSKQSIDTEKLCNSMKATKNDGHIHSKSIKPRQLDRAAIEVQTIVAASKFLIEDGGGFYAQPKEVQQTGAGLLIIECGNVLPQRLLQDPDAAIAKLLEMHKNGTIVDILYRNFGLWMSNNDKQEKESVERTSEVLQEVSRSIKAFDPKHVPEGKVMESALQEIGKIHDYLAYRINLEKYLQHKCEVEKKLEDKRSKFIANLLEDFDNAS